MQIRLDPILKEDAEGVLNAIGLSPTEYVRMSLRQLVMQKGLPFEARIPNAETIEAINEPRAGLKRYTSSKAMVDDILSKGD